MGRERQTLLAWTAGLRDGPGRRLFFLGEGLFVFRLMLLYTVMSLTARLAMSSLHRVSDRLQGDDSEIPIGRLLFRHKNYRAEQRSDFRLVRRGSPHRPSPGP
jgi:hypothetical protein